MSLVKSEVLETNKQELEIFVDAKTFQEACKKAYLKDAKRINIPGFRKGKAPKKVIEQRFGSDVFFSTAMDMVCPKAVDDAIHEAKLDVVSLEKIEPIKVSEQEGFSFKAICILKPSAEIENYKGIEVKVEENEVDDDLVQKQLDSLRERNGRLVSVEGRAAQKDDIAVLDYEGFVDDKPFDGGKAQNYSLKLGSNQFIAGFEDQVIGHKAGDEFDVDVVFPQDYHHEQLKGKPAKFKCKLNEIKVLKLPAEDDEFAKDVSKFETLKEFKDDIKQNLIKQAEARKKESIRSQITMFLVKNVKAQIPNVMIENRSDDMAKNFEDRLASQGLNLDQYLAFTRTSGYDMVQNIRTRAEFQIRTDLALEKIAELEKLEISEADYENERKEIAKHYGLKVDQIKQLFPNEYLKHNLILQKAFEFLENNAKITTTSKKEESKEKATASKETSTEPSGKSTEQVSEKKKTARAQSTKVGAAKAEKESKKVEVKAKTKDTKSSTKSESKTTKVRATRARSAKPKVDKADEGDKK